VKGEPLPPFLPSFRVLLTCCVAASLLRAIRNITEDPSTSAQFLSLRPSLALFLIGRSSLDTSCTFPPFQGTVGVRSLDYYTDRLPSRPLSPSSTMLDRLPPEILIFVLDEVEGDATSWGHKTLSSCCLVSKAFSQLAQPILWRRLHLRSPREFRAFAVAELARTHTIDLELVRDEEDGPVVVDAIQSAPRLARVRLFGWFRVSLTPDEVAALCALRGKPVSLLICQN
jgi:hypothetical protein